MACLQCLINEHRYHKAIVKKYKEKNKQKMLNVKCRIKHYPYFICRMMNKTYSIEERILLEL